MTPIPWGDLTRLGLVELGLNPDVFWSLTPAELILISGLGADDARSISRQGFDALMQKFPDSDAEAK